MNDRKDYRRRASQPAWPTGEDPDLAARREHSKERTGFWSPLWEDDEEPGAGPRAASGRATRTARANGPTSGHRQPEPPRAGQRHRIAEPPVNQPARRVPARTPASMRSGPAAAPPRPGARPAGGARTQVRWPGTADLADEQTDLLPPVPVPSQPGREPELLTHREPDYDEELVQDLDEEDRPPSDDDRRKRRKKIWRRIRRTMYTFIALMIIGPILAFFIAYQLVEVPTLSEVAAKQGQVVTLTYADGTTELSKIVPSTGDRTMVQYGDIPRHVLQAVYSAEDKDFETNAGFDISGVLRAGWNQVGGGDGGGSTITQQYIKQATGDDERTLTRKALEVVKSYKMNNTFSKPEIITAYLNTVYLGRSAYGIAAGARAYFKKELKDLTQSEAALLAGMIQSPGRFKEDAYMQRRWNFVMDQMVANGWLPSETRKAEKFPTQIPFEQARAQAVTDARGHIQEQVMAEVEEKLGLDEGEIHSRGFKVVTTIDPTAQKLAEDAVHEVMAKQPAEYRSALVAVAPENGEIKAYYGGDNGVGTDWAERPQQPGSSFKAFDLVALLQKGKGLGETYDASSPRTIGGVPVRNASKSSCGKECTVLQATKESLNTVFYDMVVNDVGAKAVADAAAAAGVRANLSEASLDGAISIGGNKTMVSTTDMASGFATFAANGMYRAPHFVKEVLYPDGKKAYTAPAEEKPAFSSDPKASGKIARNVTEALLPVPEYSKIKCADGRLCAGKTGTNQYGETEKNEKAWMVGYTPQISTAVSMAKDGGGDIGKVFGAGAPGQIWKKFMDSYHKAFNLPKANFGKFEPIGKDAPGTGSSSSKKPTRTTQPTATQTEPPDDPPQTRPTRPTRPTTPPTKPTLPLPGGGGL